MKLTIDIPDDKVQRFDDDRKYLFAGIILPENLGDVETYLTSLATQRIVFALDAFHADAQAVAKREGWE